MWRSVRKIINVIVLEMLMLLVGWSFLYLQNANTIGPHFSGDGCIGCLPITYGSLLPVFAPNLLILVSPPLNLTYCKTRILPFKSRKITNINDKSTKIIGQELVDGASKFLIN